MKQILILTMVIANLFSLFIPKTFSQIVSPVIEPGKIELTPELESTVGPPWMGWVDGGLYNMQKRQSVRVSEDQPINVNASIVLFTKALNIEHKAKVGAKSYGDAYVHGFAKKQTDPLPGKYDYGTPDGFDYNYGCGGGHGHINAWGQGGAGGGPGGPIIVLRGDSIIINGEIFADGFRGGQYLHDISDPKPDDYGDGHAGSGGCILIIAKHLEIGSEAYIHANGGSYARHWDKIQGGGGRVKIFYQTGTISEEAIIEARGTEPKVGQEYEEWMDEYQGTVHIERLGHIPKVFGSPGDFNEDGEVDHKDLFLLNPGWKPTIKP